MNKRIERDSLGEVAVDASRNWGAQTQRSLENFPIGTEKMPAEIIHAFAWLKQACAEVNHALGKLDGDKADVIAAVCTEIVNGCHQAEFPLSVWQTGSGTQSNMNVNEVVAHLAAAKGVALHPNDHVNMSQSSNDTFPTAMNIAAVCLLEDKLLPALDGMVATLCRLEEDNADVLKIGRTHLQDATPILFSQEISGWRTMLEENRRMVESALPHLRQLAIGGTAVGTGLNAPAGFDRLVCDRLSALSGKAFVPAPNKFHALTSKDAFVFAHGALKALACNMMKIANDIRWLASGPRCGLGEIEIPANEPGSSIMPGKVNPTQCESVTMVACRVMGNDTAVGVAASQGNFELNVFMPVCADAFLQSARILADSLVTFDRNCVQGIRADRGQMAHHLEHSLMLVTALSPVIGYDKAAQVAKYAHEEGCTLKEAATLLGYLDAADFDRLVRPEQMV